MFRRHSDSARGERSTNVAGLLVLLAITAVAAAAQGEDAEKAVRAWTPSLSLGFSVFNQDSSGIITSSFTDNFGTGRSDRMLTSTFNGDVALHTPALGTGVLAPRIFMRAGFQIPLSDTFTSQKIARTLSAPQNPDGTADYNQVCPDARDAVPNPGTCQISADILTTLKANWRAGVGLDFTLPWGDRHVSIRPAIDYFGQAIEGTGNITRTQKVPSKTIRDTVSDSSSTAVFHGLGPSLDFDIDVARAGPLSLQIFLTTSFYWILGSTSTSFDASGTRACNGNAEFCAPYLAQPPVTGSFTAEVGDFVAEGGAGLRIVWTGK